MLLSKIILYSVYALLIVLLLAVFAIGALDRYKKVSFKNYLKTISLYCCSIPLAAGAYFLWALLLSVVAALFIWLIHIRHF
jgi:hypothetical protein